MSIVIFIIIITALVFVHELGHFLFAKYFKMRVDEFAVGFPPTLFSVVKGGTKYAINLIPFGGYVKIFGENYTEQEESEQSVKDSFTSKPRYAQVLVLIAGILFNIIFAWILFSASLYIGAPKEAAPNESGQLVVTRVISGSPAEKAGLKAGDVIESVTVTEKIENPNTADVKKTVEASGGKAVAFQINHSGQKSDLAIVPEKNISGTDYAVGIEMVRIKTERLPFFAAAWEGTKTTWYALKGTVIGIYGFLSQAFQAKAHLNEVSGPIGIVSLIGDASRFGLSYLVSFAALISINLAVINLHFEILGK